MVTAAARRSFYAEFRYDMNGKVVANVDTQADRIDIPAEALGRGVFVVVAQNVKGQKMNVKVIL